MIKIELTLTETFSLHELVERDLYAINNYKDYTLLPTPKHDKATMENLLNVLSRALISEYVLNKYYDHICKDCYTYQLEYEYNDSEYYRTANGELSQDPRHGKDVTITIRDHDHITLLTIWAFNKGLIELDDIVGRDDTGFYFAKMDETSSDVDTYTSEILKEINNSFNNQKRKL